MEILKSWKLTIFHEHEYSSETSINHGPKQRSDMSTFFFAIYLSDLSRSFLHKREIIVNTDDIIFKFYIIYIIYLIKTSFERDQNINNLQEKITLHIVSDILDSQA